MIYQTGLDCRGKLELFSSMYFGRRAEDILLIHSRFEEDEEEMRAYTEILYGQSSSSAETVIPKDRRLFSPKTARESAAIRSLCTAAEKFRRIPLPWGTLCGVRPAKLARQMLEEGFFAEEIRSQLEDVYFVEPEKARLAAEVAENERPLIDRATADSVCVYVGIPFCPSRCSYCSFVSRDMRTAGKYLEEFLRLLAVEISEGAKLLRSRGISCMSVYIGGGTPAVMTPEQTAALCSHIRREFDLGDEVEFTIEAGRADVLTAEKLKAAKDSGANRISVNPQSMNDLTLRRINRRHTAAEVVRAFGLAREAGFDNINMDLIAGLPGERAEDFARSVREVTALDPESVTIHTLYKKRAADMAMREVSSADVREVGKMLTAGYSALYEHGYAPYYMYRQKNTIGNLENTGWAKKGYESFYNIAIMEEISSIAAFGGGGSSKAVLGEGKVERVFNFKEPDEYIKRFAEILERKRALVKLFK